MLNPSFPKIESAKIRNFTLPAELVSAVKENNSNYATGPELRLQEVYGTELWNKLNSLGITPSFLNGKRILDLCSGTGFLSYHLLNKSSPESITLADISADEVQMSRELLKNHGKNTDLEFRVQDVLEFGPESHGSFDVVIGNSFLHHLYDLPWAANVFASLLKEGGTFITIHEPTPFAVALESGSYKEIVKYLIRGKAGYLDRYRPEGVKDLSVLGGDIWLFSPGQLEQVFSSSGFSKVKSQYWHIMRPLIVARKKLHISAEKGKLEPHEEHALRRTIDVDGVLRRTVPRSLRGSVSLRADK